MPVLSEFGGQATVTEDAQDLYREAVAELFGMLGSAHPVAADLRALLLHFDNNWEQLHQLLARMLSVRDQWHVYVGVHNSPEESQSHLLATVDSIVHEALTALHSELESVALSYDACIARLDTLLEELIGALEERGELENTIVVLTSDHGEHLGEHHLLDHQYSVYEELLHVPLVVRAPRGLRGPGGFEPGRETAPVQLIDLFPTLLEACGVPGQEDADPRVRALTAPDPERRSLAQYFAPPKSWIHEIE